MAPPSLTYLLRGPFNFLRPEMQEIRRLMPDASEVLPLPQRVFLEDESATPLWGFPILVTPELMKLRQALQEYLEQEEKMQASVVQRTSVDRLAYNQAWETYRQLLSRALENVTLSSYGRNYPGTFWLYHSTDVARILKETPRRIVRIDTALARNHGDAIKYRVFDRFQDRMLSTTYDLVNRLSVDTEEMEEELFPRLLRRMLDNVLIFTEDHLGPTLSELSSYFSGYVKIDGRELRQRLDALAEWHERQLRVDHDLRNTVRHLLDTDPEENPRQTLNQGPYLRLLATRPGYDERTLLTTEQVQMWEKLLTKLQEFELFHALRRFAIPMKSKGDRLFCRPSNLSRTWHGAQELYLSPATRPLDFMAPWVVDPVVDRQGMVYDITDFSALVSVQRMAGSEAQDQSFRMMFRFQRRINRLAHSHRIKLEKYLGDGAFYSSRHPRELLICAVHLQRHYAKALTEGFPFDHGMRVALNYGSYRLIPLRSTSGGDSDRYEFFGHGLIELSRLTSGKATREIDEVKNLLISQGYNERTVHNFFEPMMERNIDTVNRQLEEQQFYAYINASGHLINEGIVATEAFVDHLEAEVPLDEIFQTSRAGLSYVVLLLPDGAENTFPVGLRKLGLATLKGLDKLPVYEVLDAAELELVPLERPAGASLLKVLEREFNQARRFTA